MDTAGTLENGWVIGVACAVLASILNNLGMNMQKRNHMNNDEKEFEAEVAESANEEDRREGYYITSTLF
jgi:molybdopterin biosynthesis enzyme